jgi:hypothetical protein
MTSHCHAPVELTKQFDVEKPGAAQEQQEDAAVKMDVRHHPFDWWDLLLFMVPVATIVFAMWCEAER